MSGIEPTPHEYAQLGKKLVAEAIRQDRVRTIRRRFVAGAAAGVVAIGGIGAAWVALANPALRTNAAYCYSEADTASNYVGAGAPAGEGPDGSQLERDVDPIELCSAVWRIGAVGPDATQPPVDGVFYDVPTLTACLRLDRIVAVFPNENRQENGEFCRELGLAPRED